MAQFICHVLHRAVSCEAEDELIKAETMPDCKVLIILQDLISKKLQCKKCRHSAK
jgi:hypothetical protein